MNWQRKSVGQGNRFIPREFTNSTTWQPSSPQPVTLAGETVDISGTSSVTVLGENLSVSDNEGQQLLGELIVQLKMFNLHMSLLTREQITEDDVKGG